jgi:hypothetical protein
MMLAVGCCLIAVMDVICGYLDGKLTKFTFVWCVCMRLRSYLSHIILFYCDCIYSVLSLYPYIQLKPRSAHAGQEPAASGRTKSRSAKGNPFGAAVPREQVLKTRGIDASVMDATIERKANVLHFTSEQEAELEAVRVALTKAEKDLLEANENELPEETFRIKAEAKRKELNDLMSKFAHVSVDANSEKGGQGEARQFERPSERERQRHGDGGGGQEGGDDDAAFASFSSVRRRHQPGEGNPHQNAERT